MGRIKEVAEKLLDCGGRGAETPERENVYPLHAYVRMPKGKWREVHGLPGYGCSDSQHHTIYWSLDEAKKYMHEGDWLIEFVPVARYRCKTEPCADPGPGGLIT